MSEKPLSISLVIPVYNEEHYLGACLDAAVRQQQPFHEIIVVDNNSTDRSRAIASQYPAVTVLTEKRQGRTYAQSTGFKAASGAILARIDADTILAADWTEIVGKILTNADAVTGKGTFYNLPAKALLSNLQVLFYQYFQKLLTGSFTLWGSNMALSKAAWQTVDAELPADSRLDEDIVLTLLLKRHGLRVAYTPRLRVQASLRRGQVGLMQTGRYLSSWPRDYWQLGYYVRGALIALVVVAILIVTLPATLLVALRNLLRQQAPL